LLKFLKIFIFPLLIFILLGGHAIGQNSIKRHREIYTFHYRTSDSLLIKKVIEKIDPGIINIENFFGKRSAIEIQIYLTRSISDFQLYVSEGIPEWAQAVAFVNKRMIILRAANADEILRLPQVLLHELVHIYLGIMSPQKRLPTWLHEGIAQYLSHESLTMDEQVFIANALYGDRMSYLTDLDSMFAFSPMKARLGYALARSAVDYFVQEYGLDALMKTLKAFNKQTVNQAFISTTGKDFVDFEAGWFNYIDEKYSWFFLLNAENIVWAILILLFFAALIRLKFKNRDTRNSWEDDIGTSEFFNEEV
jgi:Peptidase MA superfamily